MAATYSASKASSTPTATPFLRQADLMVLALALVALLLGALLRQQSLFATDAVNVDGLSVGIPVSSFPAIAGGQRVYTTPGGLTVRATNGPAPTTGADDPIVLTTGRAISQGEALDMYRTVSTSTTTIGERPAGVLEYMYVNGGNGSLFASTLEVLHGYELVVAQGDQLYSVALEGPEAQWDDVQALWPRVVRSLRFEGVTE